MLIKIGNTDITKYVQESTYKLNSVDKYVSWEDALFRQHKRKVRSQIIGSFELVFVTESDFADFVSLIHDNSASNTLIMTVYVSNTGETVTKHFFYKLSSSVSRRISDAYTFKRLIFELEEQ